jgi:hypothetical protein
MKTLLSIVMMIVAASVYGQKILKEGYLRYFESATRTFGNGNVSKESAIHTMAFSPQYFKIVTEPKKGVMHTVLSDFSNKISTNYITNFDRYYKLQNEQYAPAFFSLGQYNAVDPVISLRSDTATIGKYKCRKAVLSFLLAEERDSVKMEVWYLPDVKIQCDDVKHPFHKLEGLPVQFSFVRKPMTRFIGPMSSVTEVVYTLKSFTGATPVDVAKIRDIQKYTTIETDELDRRILEVNSSPHPERMADK